MRCRVLSMRLLSSSCANSVGTSQHVLVMTAKNLSCLNDFELACCDSVQFCTTVFPWINKINRHLSYFLYFLNILKHLGLCPGFKIILRYASLASTHIFCTISIETAGTWNAMAIELVQEIGWRINVITEYSRDTTFLFQRLSIAVQQGNAVSFQNTMTTDWAAVIALS